MKTEIIIFNATESVAESISKDIVTFAFLALCIWFSHDQGGGWWTFATSIMFLFFLAARLPGERSRQTALKGKRDAMKWASSLSEDEA